MDLRNKDLAGCNLEWADLTEADLRGAKLSGANLHGAFLTGAQLDRADLRQARLDDAYLLMTDFGLATVDGMTVTGAIWDQGTTWPPGFEPPETTATMWHGARE